MDAPYQRSGFTLVELLTVVALIGVLVGLAIPAVQSVRESARRSHCQNNLRQLSLAMLNYESSHRQFPPGQIIPCDSDQDYLIDINTYSLAGHLGFIFPFLEQEQISKQFSNEFWSTENGQSPWYGDELNWDKTNFLVEVLRCPSDGFGNAPELAIGNYSSGPAPVKAMVRISSPAGFLGWTNYLGSSGTLQTCETGAGSTGVFFELSEVKTAHISDGLSSTLLMGEVFGGFGVNPQAGVVETRHHFFQNGLGTSQFFFDQTDDQVDDLLFMFSSQHMGGDLVNISFADGHIEALHSTVDPAILEAIGSRNGGENYENR